MAFNSVMIIVHDSSGRPVSGLRQPSQTPAAVSADPSRAVYYQGCLPFGVYCHS